MAEDNRDIFEKALDNAPVIGGGLLGAVVGNKLARRLSKKSHDYNKEYHDNTFNGREINDRHSPERWVSPEEQLRIRRLYNRSRDVMSASGMIGAAAGGYAGAATAGAATRKRRK